MAKQAMAGADRQFIGNSWLAYLLTRTEPHWWLLLVLRGRY
jgi:hypothetical protein